MTNYPKVLIRGVNWVGDTVMTLPALKELRRLFPLSQLSVWAPRGLMPLLAATGVTNGPAIPQPQSVNKLTRPFSMARQLRVHRFDLIIFLQNAFESAFTAFLAGIPERWGYATDMRGPLLTMAVPLDPAIRSKHQVYYYLALVERIAHRLSATPSSGDPDCSISLNKATLLAARSILIDAGLAPDRPFVCLCPGSVNSDAKRWSAKSFSELGRMLAREGMQVVVMGASSERALAESIRRDIEAEGAVVAGESDLVTSLGIMRLSRIVVSNDTGSAHLAVAAQAPVLTIFGPTIPGATAPFGENAHILMDSTSCAPCRYFTCPKSDHPCMTSITAQGVFNRVMELI